MNTPSKLKHLAGSYDYEHYLPDYDFDQILNGDKKSIIFPFDIKKGDIILALPLDRYVNKDKYLELFLRVTHICNHKTTNVVSFERVRWGGKIANGTLGVGEWCVVDKKLEECSRSLTQANINIAVLCSNLQIARLFGPLNESEAWNKLAEECGFHDNKCNTRNDFVKLVNQFIKR
jgi:hypothetical protein